MDNKTKALVPLKDLQIEKIFTDKNTRGEILNDIKKYALRTVFDTTTTKGRKDCVSHASDVRRSAKAVDKKGLAMTKGMRDEIQRVNEIRTEVNDFLKPIAIEVRSPVTAWEEEDKKKKDKEETRVRELEEKVDAIACYKPRNDAGVPIPPEQATAKQLETSVNELSEIDFKTLHLDEFHEKGINAKKERLIELRSILDFRKEQDQLEESKKKLAEKEAKVKTDKKAIEDTKRKLEEQAEKTEKNRKRGLAVRLQSIKDFEIQSIKDFEENNDNYLNAPSIKQAILALESVIVDESFEELEVEAALKKDSILNDLASQLPIAAKNDAIAAKELKESQQEEARKIVEKEEKEKEEIDSIAKKKRQDDMEHRRTYNREILAVLNDYHFGENEAVTILGLIVRGKLPHVSIEY